LTCLAAVGAALVGCADNPPPAPVAKADSPESTPEKIRAKLASDQSEPSDVSTTSDKASDEPAEEGWGTLKGKFVYDGVAPQPAKINANAGGCNNNNLFNESLVVSKDGELANVIIWVTTPKVKIHSSYDDLKKTTMSLGNKNCRFDPHVATYWTEQPLELKNFDPVGHNFDASGLQNNIAFNDSVPANGAAIKTGIRKSERLPTGVKCGSHTWMQGWLLVQEHPYMAVTAPDGTFEIENLPTGELEFQFWHEKAGYVREVNVEGKPAEWKRGRATLSIKPGENDLGVVKVPASLFNK
jgi:hypothetical protein